MFDGRVCPGRECELLDSDVRYRSGVTYVRTWHICCAVYGGLYVRRPGTAFRLELAVRPPRCPN
jgi:hypothetical protein